MNFECCKGCVPPKRHVGCHSECEEYLKDKEELKKRKEQIKMNESISLSNYDFNKIGYSNARRYRK